MSDAAATEAQLALVRAAFAAIAQGDVDGMLRHYGADLVMEMPYTDPPTRLETRDVVRDHLRRAFEVFRFTLTVTAVYPTTDPDLLILEYDSQGRILSSGAPYANSYVGFYWFENGLISQVREYFNPQAATRALSSTT